MKPDPPPLSSHTDLELTRLCDQAGFVFREGWFVERSTLEDLTLLLRHPQPPRAYPLGRRLLADARSFAGLGWLAGALVTLWGALVHAPLTIGLGLLIFLMMATFLFRGTRAIRQGRLLLGRTTHVIQRATVITSTLDRVELALHPAEPWATVEVQVPPAPNRYLLRRGDSYEVLVLAGTRPEDVRLMGFRPLADGETDAEPTGSDPT